MPTPYWSELFREWVLVADDGEINQEPTAPHHIRQLSLLAPVPQRITADQPEDAWVVYRKREWPLLRRLSEEDRAWVHEVKRIFGGRLIEVA